jgi:hypothetical protein
VPRGHSNPRRRRHSQGREDRGQVCPLTRCNPTSPVLRFPCIRPYATRGNEDGSGALLQPPPEQEDKESSPSLSMELKFELNTRLTVSCVVAVASIGVRLVVRIDRARQHTFWRSVTPSSFY